MAKLWTSSNLLLVLTLAASLFGNAKAGVISIGTAQAANPTNFENFDGPFGGQYAGNQYSQDGLTFTTIASRGALIISNRNCSPTGMNGSFLYIGLANPCNIDQNYFNGVSAMFDKNVEELSFKAYSYGSNHGYNLEALLNGGVISSFDISGIFSNKYVLLSGMVFDEIRISEAGPSSHSLLAIDDLRWRAVANAEPAPSGKIPLPSTIALFVAGALCLGYARKRKRA